MTIGGYTMLEWKDLLCEDRIRTSSRKKTEQQDYVTRNEFEADYDRIVGSSSVRRLQDKAQVFPLQKNDFVRTRLTHSMEVSAIARSLAKTVGMSLEKNGEFKREDTEKLMGMLQTAGLIHDLGNPPFGHYGETVIRNWYKEVVLKEKKEHDPHYKMKQEDYDFLYFDGNVQNLRIVTKLQTLNDQYGANFTYGTLATIIKYPYNSVNSKNEKNKFGYYKSEEDIINKIWYKTGLKEGVRHPATFLLEAADDIVYICDDIEDGVKKGYIPWFKEYDNLEKEFGTEEKYAEIFGNLKAIQLNKDMTEEERILTHVRLFRNFVQGYLIKSAVKCFLNEYDKIMNGQYELNDLLKNDEKLIKKMKKITVIYCFACDEVLTLEVVGNRVIRELLDIFYNALITSNYKIIEDTTKYEGKIYHMISDNYKYIAKFDYNKGKSRTLENITDYDKIHLIVDFISGMTDSYAVLLYKKLVGINLPE